MIPKKIAALLILFAFATASANSALAQGAGFNTKGGGGGLHSRNSHGGGFHGGGFHGAASTDEDPTEEASLDTGSWTATGTITAVDFPTGTESLLVTMSALCSASV